MYVRAGRPAFARPCVGVHKSTSLMSWELNWLTYLEKCVNFVKDSRSGKFCICIFTFFNQPAHSCYFLNFVILRRRQYLTCRENFEGLSGWSEWMCLCYVWSPSILMLSLVFLEYLEKRWNGAYYKHLDKTNDSCKTARTKWTFKTRRRTKTNLYTITIKFTMIHKIYY